MIKSFRDKNTERLFRREFVAGFPVDATRAAQRKLEILHAAEKLGDLQSPPGNRLEKLSGDRAGQHSIRIDRRLRLCFRWQGIDAYDVEIVDYH